MQQKKMSHMHTSRHQSSDLISSRHQNSAHFSFRFVYAYNGDPCCPPMLDGVVQTHVFAFPSVALRQAHARILNHDLTCFLYSCKNIFQIFINEAPGQGETLKSHCTIICICSNKWLKNNEEKKPTKKNSMQVILI